MAVSKYLGVILISLTLLVSGCSRKVQDYEENLEFFKKTCDDGNSASCYMLGKIYASGEIVKTNFFEAGEYYKKSCDKNNGIGCYHLGMLYYTGSGVRQDTTKLEEFLKKSCDNEYAKGCYKLGRLYLDGQGGITKDQQKALEFFGKACDFKDEGSCLLYNKLKARGIQTPVAYPQQNLKSTSKGEEIFNSRCVSCHAQKASKSALNKSQIIAGWDTIKIVASLNGYKNDEGGPLKGVMKSIAISLSDEDISAVAETISSFK